MFTIIGADGNEYGPVAAANILEWIIAGRANLQTKARRIGETEWKTLGDFAEFTAPPGLAAPAAPIVPAAIPAPFAPAAVPASFTPVDGLADASRWLRLGAQLVDGLISCLCIAPGFVILASAGVFSTPDSPNAALMIGGFAVMGVGMLLLLAFQIYLLVTRGQTIGKKLLGIKIVNFDDETNPGFVKVILLRIVVNGLIGAVPFIGAIYSLVDICFIFRDDRRCLHDLIAGTKVVVA